MRRSAVGPLLVCAIGLAALVGCSGDGDDGTPSSTTTTEDLGTIAPDDPALAELLLTEADLPGGFAPSPDVDDTVTTFCAGQDATAGLSASGRAIVAFTRSPEGASVIEVVFRFDDDGAERFVAQAGELLESCNEIPDISGLAFTYEPASPDVEAALDGADRHEVRFGTSVGSGDLTVQIAVVRVGDLGALVAVLGVQQPRAVSDELAAQAFGAAVARLG